MTRPKMRFFLAQKSALMMIIIALSIPHTTGAKQNTFFLPNKVEQSTPKINFATQELAEQSINQPTSLDFGPDGRLYVSQQDGLIHAYTIEIIEGNYQTTATEIIEVIVTATPNHNDDGRENVNQERLITGLMSAGTAQAPILYVASSDWRISVNNPSDVDTNSSVLTRLTWQGNGINDPNGSWEKVDLVRGLPRSEGNHALNGMDLDPATNTLYIMSGGNTNMGAPSANFSGKPQYYLSAALLAIDLNMLERMTIFTDPRAETQFVYDLPTLNDPTRLDIGNNHPDFPYSPDHPRYNNIIDLGDPFGGNKGLNQAIPEPDGPVQIYAPGFRNSYDVLFTSKGRLYAVDNGPNGSWGGPPLIYDAAGESKLSTSYDAEAGDYCTNELNEDKSNAHGDLLHYISEAGYYGGHPVPIRAYPERAGIYLYGKTVEGWIQEGPVYNFMELLPADFVAENFSDHPQECDYSTTARMIDTTGGSTNGIAEYTASNFDGALQGNILTASFEDVIYRYEMNETGDGWVDKEILFTGFGRLPLDVVTQGDDDIFPGTIWAVSYASDSITVFTPQDTADEPSTDNPPTIIECSGRPDASLDEDGDGFSNSDELQKGTNPCNGSSQPTDNDGDRISDRKDLDDDNDGIADMEDPFALDPANGTTTTLPLRYDFLNSDPGTGLFGIGFTGLINNGVDNYLDQFDPNRLVAGGATGLLTVEAVSTGDARLDNNDQEYGFQFGVDVDRNSQPFVVRSRLLPPFFAVNGISNMPRIGQSAGMFVGDGSQSNYLKIVLSANNSQAAVGIFLEEADRLVSQAIYPLEMNNLLDASEIDLLLDIDPITGAVQPKVAENSGQAIALGDPLKIPLAWLAPDDIQGLAIGLLATASTSGVTFNATWDYIEAEFLQDEESDPQIMLGDVNCDGIVNAIDTVLILQYDIRFRGGLTICDRTTTEETTIYLPACDIDKNGSCNAGDALRVLRCDAGLEKEGCGR